MEEKIVPSLQKKDFYKQMVSLNYDTEVNRLLPGYNDELVPLVSSEIGEKSQNGAVLDIGSGTGNIDEIIADRYVPRTIDLVEISASMIEKSKVRLKDKKSAINFHNISALDFRAESNSFDSVLSNLVIHNIPPSGKPKLINNIYGWLKDGGIFVWTDLVNFADRNKLEQCLEERRRIAIEMGTTEEFADENFRKEREEDHMITAEEMVSLLAQAGFEKIEIIWQKYNAVTIRATK